MHYFLLFILFVYVSERHHGFIIMAINQSLICENTPEFVCARVNGLGLRVFIQLLQLLLTITAGTAINK